METVGSHFQNDPLKTYIPHISLTAYINHFGIKKHRFIRVNDLKYVSFDLYKHSHLLFVKLAAAKTNVPNVPFRLLICCQNIVMLMADINTENILYLTFWQPLYLLFFKMAAIKTNYVHTNKTLQIELLCWHQNSQYLTSAVSTCN